MEDASASKAEKLKALQAACDRHSDNIRDAMLGACASLLGTFLVLLPVSLEPMDMIL